jgi:hypothetical protein
MLHARVTAWNTSPPRSGNHAYTTRLFRKKCHGSRVFSHPTEIESTPVSAAGLPPSRTAVTNRPRKLPDTSSVAAPVVTDMRSLTWRRGDEQQQ